MRIVAFQPAAGKRERQAIEAFAHGCGAVLREAEAGYVPCDVAVIYGMVKARWGPHREQRYPVSEAVGLGTTTHIAGAREVIKAADAAMWHPLSEHKVDILRQHKGRVLVIERGYVDRDDRWSAGWDGINGRADFRSCGMSDGRWRNLFGGRMKPWRRGGQYVLVIGQVPWDVSVQDTDHVGWCQATVSALQERGFDVRFRSHPLARGVEYGVDAVLDQRSLADALAGAIGVVTWSSNVGVDAALTGVPVVAMDRGSMAWMIAGHSLDEVAKPYCPDRARWAAELAYAQWTVDEFRSGAAWTHLCR